MKRWAVILFSLGLVACQSSSTYSSSYDSSPSWQSSTVTDVSGEGKWKRIGTTPLDVVSDREKAARRLNGDYAECQRYLDPANFSLPIDEDNGDRDSRNDASQANLQFSHTLAGCMRSKGWVFVPGAGGESSFALDPFAQQRSTPFQQVQMTPPPIPTPAVASVPPQMGQPESNTPSAYTEPGFSYYGPQTQPAAPTSVASTPQVVSEIPPQTPSKPHKKKPKKKAAAEEPVYIK